MPAVPGPPAPARWASPRAPSLPAPSRASRFRTRSRRSRHPPPLGPLGLVPPPAVVGRWRARATLAGRAPVGESLEAARRLGGLPDRGATAQAWLAAALGDPVHAPAAGVACRHLVADGPVGLHHALEQLEHGLQVVDLSHRRPGADPAQEAQLVLPVVPRSGDRALVEQGGADRPIGIGAEAPGRLLEVP